VGHRLGLSANSGRRLPWAGKNYELKGGEKSEKEIQVDVNVDSWQKTPAPARTSKMLIHHRLGITPASEPANRVRSTGTRKLLDIWPPFPISISCYPPWSRMGVGAITTSLRRCNDAIVYPIPDSDRLLGYDLYGLGSGTICCRDG